MSDIDAWIDGEGPEPEAVRALFDPLRADALPPELAEDLERDLFEALARHGTGAAPPPALPLDFETWAELSAFFLGAGPDERIDVLDEQGIALEDWTLCDNHYLISLAGDVVARRTTRADLYARKCAEVIARRKTLPSAAEPLPLLAARRPRPAAAPAPEAPPPAAAPAVATFQKAEQAPGGLPPIAPVPDITRGTAAGYELPTALLEQRGKLPFQPAPVGQAPPPPAPPAAPPAAASGKTVSLPDGLGIPRETLPLGTDMMALLRPALPFGGQAMGGGDAPSPPGGLPVPSETLPLGTDMMAHMRAALPYAEQTLGGGDAPYPKWEVITYASFCVDLAMEPQNKDAIMERYQVRGEPSRVALDNAWRQVLAADPAKRALFDQLSAQYAAMKRGQGR